MSASESFPPLLEIVSSIPLLRLHFRGQRRCICEGWRCELKSEAAAADLKAGRLARKLAGFRAAHQPNPPPCSCSSHILCLGEKKKKDTLDPSLEVATIRGISGLRYSESFAVIAEVSMGRGRGGVE